MRRVVITGIGAITPLGNTLSKIWENLVNGKSGAGLITHFDTSRHQTKIACEVTDFNPCDLLGPKAARRRDRFVQFSSAAGYLAWQDSGLDISREDPTRVGVEVASGIGGAETWDEGSLTLAKHGPGKISAFFVPMLISNMAAGILSAIIGAKGLSLGINSACAGGNHSIGEAWHVIKRDDTDIMLAGGTEAAIQPLSVAGFEQIGALSFRNDEPTRASRPFDNDRNGFVMGEGSAILVLEELQHALRRNAHIYAEIVGYGASADANPKSEVQIDPEGSLTSMRKALGNAKITHIDYVNAHATSTPLGDPAESWAINQALGASAKMTPVSSTKSMHGHLLGAAGAIESAICCLTIIHQVIPPTINLEHPDPACDLCHVANTAREQKIDYAMNNSFGFGGQNATLIFKKFTG